MHTTDNFDKQLISGAKIDQNLEDSFPASDPSWTLCTDHRAKSARIMPETSKINQASNLLSYPVNNNDHIQGDASAAVTLLMYGAYECPHCVEGYKIVKQIQGQFGEQLRFVFRHFPRINVHPHAEAAAEVVEAAGEQDKFWEMHDMLFDNYNRLAGEHLLGYAEALGLDIDQFNLAISRRAFAPRVRADLISGMESGVRGTPTYFINGVKHFGSGQFGTLAEAIDSSIGERE